MAIVDVIATFHVLGWPIGMMKRLNDIYGEKIGLKGLFSVISVSTPIDIIVVPRPSTDVLLKREA